MMKAVEDRNRVREKMVQFLRDKGLKEGLILLKKYGAGRFTEIRHVDLVDLEADLDRVK